jgi:hypothetical protein
VTNVQRSDYWPSRTGRADGSRSHPDDEAHRGKVRELLRDAGRASGLGGKHWSFESNDRRDWKASSVQRWADAAHIDVSFVFDGLDVPEELKEGPEGETFEEQRFRVKEVIKAIRLGQGVSMLEMDRRLGQQYCCYHAWERRATDFRLSAAQRTVRALGGVFRVELKHRHNAGLLKRIAKRK